MVRVVASLTSGMEREDKAPCRWCHVGRNSLVGQLQAGKLEMVQVAVASGTEWCHVGGSSAVGRWELGQPQEMVLGLVLT